MTAHPEICKYRRPGDMALRKLAMETGTVFHFDTINAKHDIRIADFDGDSIL